MLFLFHEIIIIRTQLKKYPVKAQQIHENIKKLFKNDFTPLYNRNLQRVPALRAFWDLEKTVLHEIRVSVLAHVLPAPGN